MNDENNTIKFIIKAIVPFSSWIIGLFCVSIIWAIDISLRPYILKTILDKIPEITPETVVLQLSTPIIFYISMSLFMTIIFRIHSYIWLILKPHLKCSLTNTLMNKMMQHSQTLFQNTFTGSIANKIKETIDSIPDLIKLSVDHFFSQFLAFIIAIFTVWTINYKFALLLTAWLIIFIFGSSCFINHLKKLGKAVAEIRSGTMGYIIDVLSNIINRASCKTPIMLNNLLFYTRNLVIL
jgi:ATP-binding cassette subfamily B protein